MRNRPVCLYWLLILPSLMVVAYQVLRAEETAAPVLAKGGAESNPPTLQPLADAVIAAKAELLPLADMNAVAQILGLPENRDADEPIYSKPREYYSKTEGIIIGHQVIVRRLQRLKRTDMVLLKSPGDSTLYLFLTSPEGKLQKAIKRTGDNNNFTNTPFTGDEAEKMFREQVELWQKWRKEWEEFQKEEAARSSPAGNDEATRKQEDGAANKVPQPLLSLADVVVAAKERTEAHSIWNAMASRYDIPENTDWDVPACGCFRKSGDPPANRLIIVRRLRKPKRTDILISFSPEERTGYWFLTSPDGKLQKAFKDTGDIKKTITTPFIGDEAEKMFREQVEFWEKWRAEREKKAEQEKAGKK